MTPQERLRTEQFAVTGPAGLLARLAPPVDFIELATGRSQAGLFPVLR
jgi:hypothetical protein